MVWSSELFGISIVFSCKQSENAYGLICLIKLGITTIFKFLLEKTRISYIFDSIDDFSIIKLSIIYQFPFKYKRYGGI